jgi:imidazolonepropionase-like amidohydrolase
MTAISRSAWCAIAAVGLSPSGFVPSHPQIVPGRIAFVGVSVLPMSTDTLLLDQTVLVQDGVVTHIGARPVVPVPGGARVIRGDGVLMPGLADMHVHLDDEADLRRHLEAGVTLTRNMRGEPRHLRWREEIAAGTRLGPRIITTGPTLTGAVRVNPRHVSVTNAAEISLEVRAQAAAGYDLVKVHSGLSRDLLVRIGAVTESTHRAVVGHLMAGGIEAALEAGQATIEHVDPDVWTEGTIDIRMAQLARAGAYFCPTFTTFYDMQADNRRPSARHRGLVAAARRHKVNLLAGTDASLPPQQPGTALIAELRYMIVAGLTPYEALRAATVHAGDFVRRHIPGLPRLGVVEIGSAADLILLPADPRSDIGVLSNPQGVMAGGRWIDLRHGPVREGSSP